MSVNNKDRETEALEDNYERLLRARSARTLAGDLNEIALRCANRPVVSALSADEVLGYDESGAPSR